MGVCVGGVLDRQRKPVVGYHTLVGAKPPPSRSIMDFKSEPSQTVTAVEHDYYRLEIFRSEERVRYLWVLESISVSDALDRILDVYGTEP